MLYYAPPPLLVVVEHSLTALSDYLWSGDCAGNGAWSETTQNVYIHTFL